MSEKEILKKSQSEQLGNMIGILGKACSMMLQEREGIIIEMDEGMFNPFGEENKILVTYMTNELRFDNYDGPLPDGSFVMIRNSEEESDNEKDSTNSNIHSEK